MDLRGKGCLNQLCQSATGRGHGKKKGELISSHAVGKTEKKIMVGECLKKKKLKKGVPEFCAFNQTISNEKRAEGTRKRLMFQKGKNL